MGFTGRLLYDGDTALVQFGARWYDPSTGRWLSKDPILLEGGLNLYAFCGNDPVNFSDPRGLAENNNTLQDGETLVQVYTDELMVLPFYPPHVLNTMVNMDVWGTGDQYYYRGHQYRADEMGNIAAGYAASEAWGPIYGAAAMVAAELLFIDRGSGTILQDARGSFYNNGIGILSQIRDHPLDAFNGIISVTSPAGIIPYVFGNWASNARTQ